MENSFIELLKTQNNDCFNWFNSLTSKKQADLIICVFDNVNTIKTFTNPNSYLIGKLQEDRIEEILKNKTLKYTRSSGTNKSGDFVVHGYKDILIEIKHYAKAVPYAEIEKMIRDMTRLNIKSGIFISEGKISKVSEKVKLLNIGDKLIYIIDISYQNNDMIGNIISFCIDILNINDIQTQYIKSEIPSYIQKINNNMGIIYDIKLQLLQLKTSFNKDIDNIQNSIVLYENKIKKYTNNINVAMYNNDNYLLLDKSTDKLVFDELIKNITGTNSNDNKLYLNALYDKYVLSINKDSIIFNNKTDIEFIIKKTKQIVIMNIDYIDNIMGLIKDGCEVKNNKVIIPLNIKYVDVINNALN